MQEIAHEFYYPEGVVVELLHVHNLAIKPPTDASLEFVYHHNTQSQGPKARVTAMQLAARIKARSEYAILLEAAALAEHHDMVIEDTYGQVNAATEEIALALTVSRHTAQRYILVGQGLRRHLQATGQAMQEGLLGFEKAAAIVESLTHVNPTIAITVQDMVLPNAPHRTPTQIRRDIARALIEIDPDHADQRNHAARRQRHITRPHPEAHGMATMRMFLPAEDAVALDAALDNAADAARAQGDERLHSQLRIDTLAEWAIGVLQDGWTGITTNATTYRTKPRPTAIKVTIPLEVLARALPGWNPHPHPTTTTNNEIYGPPNNQNPPDEDRANPQNPPGENLERENPDSKKPEDPDITEDVPTGRTEAAWLEGYGPITPAVALLLAAGGTWQRIITDTLTGAPLDVGRERYRPPTQILQAIALVHQTCARPGCNTPVSRCEIDHIMEWQHGGTTALANLAPLCKRCHRLKTAGAGREYLDRDSGAWRWKTLAGNTYPFTPEREKRITLYETQPTTTPPDPDAKPPF